MNDRVRLLLSRISALEDELRSVLHEEGERDYFQVEGKCIEFEQPVIEANSRLKDDFSGWLLSKRPQNLLTGPIIYSMIIPLLILDLCVSLYQVSCFPIYRIAKVRRGDYIVLDRQHLGYLDFIGKFHCTYCAYGAGLIAYVGEIVARTEQYFCPIKHAQKVLNRHSRYADFLDYGEAAEFEARLEAFRQILEKEK